MVASTEDCFANVIQDFLVCTTVHKAHKVGQATSELYIRIVLDKSVKCTKVFSNSENPCFNELNCTLAELLRLTILYELKKRATCKKHHTLGELLIDMHSVWNQPNHCYYKKWGQFETPIAAMGHAHPDEARGHLQIDLAIVTRHTPPTNIIRPDEMDFNMKKWQIDQNYDDINSNLLQNCNNQQARCNIRYYMIFYRGHFVKKSDYLIQGKTPISKNTANPVWNQEITYAWMYPSVAQMFHIQIYAHEHLIWRSVAECELHFDQIAFNDKPSLGPTYLHFYDASNRNNYIGRLLFELRSEMIEAITTRVLATTLVPALDTLRFWSEDYFRLEFMPLQMQFILSSSSSCKYTMKFAEHTSNVIECNLKSYAGEFRRACNRKHNQLHAPYKSCHILVTLPDNRNKFDSDYFMINALQYFKTELETFRIFQLKFSSNIRQQAKCLKGIIIGILEHFKQGLKKQPFSYAHNQERTTWSINRQTFLTEYFDKFPKELRNLRRKLKVINLNHLEIAIEEVYLELIRHANELSALISTTGLQDNFPELLLVLHSGNRTSYCRLDAKHFVDMSKRNGIRNQCWEIKTFIFKDAHCTHSCQQCGCINGAVMGCLGVFAESDFKDFQQTIAHDWRLNEQNLWEPVVEYTTFNCRAFVHQAKIRPGYDVNGLCDAHARIYFADTAIETYSMPETLSPVWNVVLTAYNIKLPGRIAWYTKHNLLVMLELFDLGGRSTLEYIGCGMLNCSVISSDSADGAAREGGSTTHTTLQDIVKMTSTLLKFQRLKSITPPPLRWTSISDTGIIRAEILLSAELVEVRIEQQQEHTKLLPTVTTGIPSTIRPNLLNFVLEVVFVGLRNYTKTMHITAAQRRIKIMMADLVLTSGLSTSAINSSINFLVAYASGIVVLPDQQEYWPAIIATDVLVADSMEYTVGAAMLLNTHAFLQRDQTAQCTPSSHSSKSTVLTLEEDESETHDEQYQPVASKPVTIHSYWKRFLNFFGLRIQTPTPPFLALMHSDVHESLERAHKVYGWWAKFYHSMHAINATDQTLRKHTLQIYSNELECRPEFSSLQDWAIPVKMVHGVKDKWSPIAAGEIYASLKLRVKLTPCQCSLRGAGDCGPDTLRPLAAAMNPKYQASVQSLGELCHIKVRVYIVQGLQLRPRNRSRDVDTYIKLTLGAKTITDRANYVPNEYNPVFGKSFELDAVIPREHNLTISVVDRQKLHDLVVGSTTIDLENRWRSKHRATVGIANEYNRSGYNLWRDVNTPSEILHDLCAKQEISPPQFHGQKVEVDGVLFRDETVLAKNEDLQERLCLTVLKNLQRLPSFEYSLVPEHVETRSLYRKEFPGIEQGKLQMWVELFDGNVHLPQPIDITPFPPSKYQLRVIIKNIKNIQLRDINIFGTHMSDVYVEAWCDDPTKKQKTDIHYRSSGDANFNWRMVFDVVYSPTEDMMLLRRKSIYNQHFEMRFPPVLYLQVWDKDRLSPDDFLSSIELNLSHFPVPDTHWHIIGNAASKKRQYINLFYAQRMQGWFDMKGMLMDRLTNEHGLGGKIELELELISDIAAADAPVGIGHEPPNALAEPHRPASSFNPLLNPLKGLHMIIWPQIRKYIIMIVLFAIIIAALVMFFSNVPYYLLGLLAP